MPITGANFSFLRSLLDQEVGIVLEGGKEYLAEARLSPLAKQESLGSVDEFIAKLRSDTAGELRRQVVDAMTTSETTFFRDNAPFEALRQHVIPELLKARAATKRLNIWYAACSTGQEPYSMAMMLAEHFPELASWQVTHLATDVSRAVLQKAQEGRYGQLEIKRGLPMSYLIKYFDKRGLDWQLNDHVRSQVTVQELNLIRPWPTFPPLDIVMIRNVLIYFDIKIKKQILENIRQLLRPDGYMFLGAAETTINIHAAFQQCRFNRAGCYALASSQSLAS